MSLNENSCENIQLTSPAKKDSHTIEQVKERVFEQDIDNELSTVEELIQTLHPDVEGTKAEGFLKSLWNYFYAVRLIKEEKDFSKAGLIVEEAAHGFKKVGQEELTDLSEGLATYAKAATELRKMNISKALELLNLTTKYINNAGQYSNSLQILMDNTKSDLLFEAAMKAMQTSDYSAAKILTEQASEASEAIAKNYHEHGTPRYFTYKGMASFYRASFALNLAFNELNNLEYEKLSGKNNPAQSVIAIEAWGYLRQGDLDDINTAVCLQISKAFVEMLEVVEELAGIMLSTCRSTVKADIKTLRNLRAKTREAIASASEAGPQAVIYVRLCESLHTKINNLERLAKPDKRGFAMHSWMMSSVIFIPLFVIASWVNSAYDNIGAGGSTLLGLCILAALVVGFGYSVSKFGIAPLLRGAEPARTIKKAAETVRGLILADK